ncbi:hypothetical protein E4T52_09899 [Aureobasidium sp. EXF-3400]|nr:hypothetical protein E4T51_08990 [Aureobasidium sp. EXF-12344]KAI4775127.1 hypothetical protein E4T52_09899 [Aureobasidium sp. EXF-3400]
MSKQSSQRLPAPALFVGPPSLNASNVSLTRANTDTSQSSRAVPSSTIPGPSSPSLTQTPLSRSNTGLSRRDTNLSRQNTNLSRQNTRDPLSRQNTNISTQQRPDGLQVPDDNTQAATGGVGLGLANTTIDEEVKRQRPRRGTAVLDAHWAALQSTLSDIELSAASSAHVFNSNHAKALEDLRAAQVELARAWGQTDAEDVSTLPSTADSKTNKEQAFRKDEDKRHSNHNKEQEKQAEQNERKLSTATTLDLTSAARRREASDKYFAAVKEGVADVVRKLDGVADAMREVEMQSRDIWGDDAKESSEMTESEFGSLSS